jgi:GNAT superfamily N-acetyltransferase
MKVQEILSQDCVLSDFLTKMIDDEAKLQGIKDDSSSFVFIIRDDDGNIIAGCNGAAVYGAIYTDQLWVHRDYRKRGLARLLMDRVHNLGKKLNCGLATVCTMNFQHALDFYLRLGYFCDFTRPGFANGSTCLFLQKDLGQEEAHEAENAAP